MAGVGNAWLRDDGFGGEVARRLEAARAARRGGGDGRRHRRPRPRLRGDARLRRAGDRRRQPPGRRAGDAVRDGARRGRRSRARSRTARRSTRTAMDPQTVLRFVKSVGAWPGRVVVIACEPADVEEMGFGLSEQVPARSSGPSTWWSRPSTSCGPTRSRRRVAVHELSLSSAIVNTVVKHADGRRGDASSACASGACARWCPDSLEFYFGFVARGTRLRGRAAGAGGRRRRALRCDACAPRVGDRDSGFRCPACGGSDVDRGERQRVRGRVDRGRGGGRMHRTKVKVVEDALDANNTIAAANRADFDRARRQGRQLHERPGRGQDDAARAGRRATWPACASACSRATCRARWTPTGWPRLHVPVTQLNTDPGFGGECHLDANMVRSALPRAAARRDRPAGDRERRQPRLPGRVPGRRGRRG